ncbi:prenyltransferase/squalene oxidase repeat-containing protein [Micromonospora auratinigra]|uniref:Squalene-hopene cyclase C-terminal domain-containing protein n=1 Tax=Micromonospora auratinigra TaxID=261654 RepID=A0A1A8ZJE9_9ACTN|nr:prenyltransferase/squalene oxidase repeat-containing protein [Micromonospora auratinigra]SBT44179.1 Squalene-hopene cyclase C-terminal domain-containing protein [Micromonospora auratinigra]
MSADDGSPADAAAHLIEAMLRDPVGQVSPSLYETARLVSSSPWLPGHAERVRHLLAGQRADGGWGPPEGYALVPTASATEALLAVLQAGSRSPVLVRAADRGLCALRRRLTAGTPIPDTPAVDLLVPALIASINDHLSRPDLPAGLRHWHARPRLGLPPGLDGRRLAAVRQAVAVGGPVPEKMLHALEIAGPVAGRAGVGRPAGVALVGASPAATAVWLGPGQDHPDTRALLAAVIGRHGGPVPCAAPITVFEHAWVVATLARAGLPVPRSAGLVDGLTAHLGPAGTPAGPGLPPDADTSSVALYALARLGVPTDPDCLWRYETVDGFCTWPGEDGFSVTTNAHVLDALGQHVRARGGVASRHRAAARRIVSALVDRQRADGSWRDRWHASPYYATVCCVLALTESGPTEPVANALARAVDWVLATQRADGSWGRWEGTAEETAYAMQILSAAGDRRPEVVAAIRRGDARLTVTGDADGPALWHDKDLYRPASIVAAAVLAARHLAARHAPAEPLSLAVPG